MIVVMDKGATEEQIEEVIGKLIGLEFNVHRSTGAVHTVLGAVGPAELVDPEEFKVMDGVMECRRIMTPYQLASRSFRPAGTVVRLESERAGTVEIGGNAAIVMAGPGGIEGEEQILKSAEIVARGGARFFRAGGLRPHLAPQQIQPLDAATLKLLRKAADLYGLLLAVEVSETAQIGLAEEYADMLLAGSQNMQNYALLAALGRSGRPVMLKRGMAATVDEWLVSADCVLSGGNGNVMLCERGIRSFESATKNTLDVTAIALVRKLSHLPVLADPSHATGRRDLVAPMARAAVAAGADGLLIDVHPDPDHALGEGAQSLKPAQYAELMLQLKTIAAAVGRSL
ncbi:MAG: 3-deoxy-7-phosphoheptulonate synthase [Acidobacteria bacterium]|nr:3-deoxy-7-phosphoheptulonate synthase [Acidobacteriota bacterium]